MSEKNLIESIEELDKIEEQYRDQAKTTDQITQGLLQLKSLYTRKIFLVKKEAEFTLKHLT